eukprot:TRINITY_DN6095_c0_g1_i12.p1 TRINITY_DN6095_c0_g1~~TRINITY_DN6095_c0_g1_i12.p1  ORF type:complete len:345 (-),score=62.46 TRINITY_DN6095_c0_g1_i12:246-1190(-)
MTWQVEFWKVKYKEVAEKYNKVQLAFRAQQQRQQQQQQQQHVNAGMHAQAWVPPQAVLSRQSSLASSGGQGPAGIEPTHSSKLMGGVQKEDNRVSVPPDSAILSIDGVPTHPLPRVICNSVPRPKLQNRNQKDMLFQPRSQQDANQQNQDNDNFQKTRGRGRGKSPGSKKTSAQQQQQQQQQQPTTNNKSGKKLQQGGGKGSQTAGSNSKDSNKQPNQQGRDHVKSRPPQKQSNATRRRGSKSNNNKASKNNNQAGARADNKKDQNDTKKLGFFCRQQNKKDQNDTKQDSFVVNNSLDVRDKQRVGNESSSVQE